jgi:hypothetical protein
MWNTELCESWGSLPKHRGVGMAKDPLELLVVGALDRDVHLVLRCRSLVIKTTLANIKSFA